MISRGAASPLNTIPPVVTGAARQASAAENGSIIASPWQLWAPNDSGNRISACRVHGGGRVSGCPTQEISSKFLRLLLEK